MDGISFTWSFKLWVEEAILSQFVAVIDYAEWTTVTVTGRSVPA